ncbi:MAG: phosphoribosyl-AMP cyclohydrolase, partial [Chloroflexota bacterium]|nr:phosphoribosyl-AMP cyclohydrolase [Chloroflexota bacterium]
MTGFDVRQSPILTLQFGADGLVPVVVQDATTAAVLMLAFMNREALEATIASGETHFWSRSRQKLWRKGETSGHHQIVRAIHVNCEENSLLLTVDQIGAVCHTGYTSCFYRRVDWDGSLTIDGEEAFSPETVYPDPSDLPIPRESASDMAGEAFARQTRLVFDAFRYLATNDLTAVSATSRLLHASSSPVTERIADELRELAGVLDGRHRHSERDADLVLEGSQVIYWVTIAALQHGVTWEALRPDRALRTHTDIEADMTARLLRADADQWREADLAKCQWPAT